MAYQSYAAVKALYQDSGEALLGQLGHRVFLRTGDVATAKFASEAFGQTQRWVTTFADTTGSGGSSTTRSQQWLVQDVVPYTEFQELPMASPEDGITGYWRSPPRPADKKKRLDEAEPFQLSGDWIEANRPKGSGNTASYLERPVGHQYLEPLSYSDLKRLQLPHLDDEADEVGEVGSARPIEPAGRPRANGANSGCATAPSALPPPPAADDFTGKLRRWIGRAWRSDGDAETRST